MVTTGFHRYSSIHKSQDLAYTTREKQSIIYFGSLFQLKGSKESLNWLTLEGLQSTQGQGHCLLNTGIGCLGDLMVLIVHVMFLARNPGSFHSFGTFIAHIFWNMYNMCLNIERLIPLTQLKHVCHGIEYIDILHCVQYRLLVGTMRVMPKRSMKTFLANFQGHRYVVNHYAELCLGTCRWWWVDPTIYNTPASTILSVVRL